MIIALPAAGERLSNGRPSFGATVSFAEGRPRFSRREAMYAFRAR